MHNLRWESVTAYPNTTFYSTDLFQSPFLPNRIWCQIGRLDIMHQNSGGFRDSVVKSEQRKYSGLQKTKTNTELNNEYLSEYKRITSTSEITEIYYLVSFCWPSVEWVILYLSYSLAGSSYV